VFLNNRYYNPTTGTFASVDPLVAATGDPYTYTNANPATLTDPSGLCVVTYGLHSYNDGKPCAGASRSAGGPTNSEDALSIANQPSSSGNPHISSSASDRLNNPDHPPTQEDVMAVYWCKSVRHCTHDGLAEWITAGVKLGLIGGGSVAIVYGPGEACTAAIELCSRLVDWLTQSEGSGAGAANGLADDGVGLEFRSDTTHIFRDDPGHLVEDTPANRSLIQSAIDPSNLRTTIELPNGSSIAQYFRTLPDGSQVWAVVRNGIEITNGGVNANPR
jgi:hypothetical protein